MPYDRSAADRVRAALSGQRGVVEKTMFGGLGFLLHEHMCVGLWREFLILRIGPDAYEDALSRPFVKEFDITGRPMTGWVMVHPDGFEDDRALRDWVDRAVAFVRTLPPKSAPRRK
jgi:TfoX/Sxy family transcriptional regulator of competence genes